MPAFAGPEIVGTLEAKLPEGTAPPAGIWARDLHVFELWREGGGFVPLRSSRPHARPLYAVERHVLVAGC